MPPTENTETEGAIPTEQDAMRPRDEASPQPAGKEEEDRLDRATFIKNTLMTLALYLGFVVIVSLFQWTFFAAAKWLCEDVQPHCVCSVTCTRWTQMSAIYVCNKRIVFANCFATHLRVDKNSTVPLRGSTRTSTHKPTPTQNTFHFGVMISKTISLVSQKTVSSEARISLFIEFDHAIW